MSQIGQTRWFGLLDFCLALTSGVILMLWPGLGYWPILLALSPWGVRLAAGRFPFKRTIFDLPLALFLGTALIGVWAAYNHEAAWFKFCMLVAALLVFYALAGQPLENLEPIAGLLTLVGACLAFYFIFSFDWSSQPEDVGLIERIGAFWMGIRPGIQLVSQQPNIVGGILAVLFPFSIVASILGWQSRQYYRFSLLVAATLVILFGLFMTSSRGAWIALISAGGFWLVWKATELFSRKRQISRLRLFAIAPVLLIIAIAFLLWIYPERVLPALDRLPGLPSGESRLDLAGSTLQLIADYPWTGAGLASFGGIYSQYIKVIPFEYFDYGHNFYLDLAVEQGLFAPLLSLIIFTLAGWLFLDRLEDQKIESKVRLLATAGFTGLVVLLIHGLMDDALYGMSGTPFLFLVPGMAVAVSGDRENYLVKRGESGAGIAAFYTHQPRMWAFSAGLLILAISSLLLGGKAILASWYSNLGAVKMSRLDLAGWPLNQWNTNPDVSAYTPAVKLFERSLSLDPGDSTAHYRLGLIALQGRDFRTANYHLQKALLQNPTHRGIYKALGFVYVWNDQPEKAALLLSQVPEATSELKQYIIFWKQQHRQDLAIKAKDMLERLPGMQSTLP